LLTKNEKNFYETIRLIAEKLNLNVLTKVRLADIVNVNKNIQSESDEWWDYFKQISQKHVDFVLADKGLSEIHLIIEVDDSSHKRADRIKRDRFVDQVLGNVGIPILHIENVIGLEEKINRLLKNKNNKGSGDVTYGQRKNYYKDSGLRHCGGRPRGIRGQGHAHHRRVHRGRRGGH
ncbi:MAG TPA: DUF2726 domain-containing protein, partial [Candidatus Fimenecus excrementigallinarum]|nr:DUF2726 domain-containing protein [Candidatus Fimenecus excrementigallinarum]